MTHFEGVRDPPEGAGPVCGVEDFFFLFLVSRGAEQFVVVVVLSHGALWRPLDSCYVAHHSQRNEWLWNLGQSRFLVPQRAAEEH